jgi:hypothetical protein
MEDTKSIYQQLKDVGVELSNHESDLYVKATIESVKILIKNEFIRFQGYKYRGRRVERPIYQRGMNHFSSQLDNSLWYELPGQYDPFWEKAKNGLVYTVIKPQIGDLNG